MKNFDLFGFVSLLAVLVLLIVVVWQAFKSYQTKTSNAGYIARDEAYRKLSEEAISLQQETVENQKKIIGELSELRKRIDGIEKTLREVE